MTASATPRASRGLAWGGTVDMFRFDFPLSLQP